MSELPNICVVGAGFMGTQIGLQCAAHGMNAHIVDPEKNART
ncbi:MAG: 3-hydroxyacyl-CoA dehydrogenase, partial [Candidatus Latescibacterota bacterium]